MITAEEAKELTANWVTYELKELEPLIRQVAVKGYRLFNTLFYPIVAADKLVKLLEKYGFTVLYNAARNISTKDIDEYTVLTIRW